MVFENIEKLKQDYTDKFVVVDASRPELRRFRDLTGVVKTVNMNGRALVEFDGNANIGWYDIDLDFLKVVDKPQVVESPSKPAAKAAAKPAAPPAAVAEKKPQPAAPSGGGMSVADILAAARGGAAPTGAAQPASPAAPATAAKPAKEAASKSAAKPVDAKSMSVADILAAARGEAPAKSAPAAKPAEKPPAAEPVVATPAEPPAEPKAAPAPSSSPAETGALPTSVPEIIEFCRQHDG